MTAINEDGVILYVLTEKEFRREIADAWLEGNKEGWSMHSDWPQDGEKYFDEKVKETP